MRNGEDYAVAVRRSDGSITVKKEKYKGFFADSPLKKIPFIRGIFVFIDSMVLGLRCTDYSASIYAQDDPDEADKDTGSDQAKESEESALEKFLMAAVMVFSFALAIGLFMVLPYFIASRLINLIGNANLLSVFEGVIRIAIFVIYILLISMMKDIRRLFQYHGAEHKCINCLENGHELTVENAAKATRLHKRCGSS